MCVGHGLSFTGFSYSQLNATANSVSVVITNTGTLAGAEIPQLYLGFPPGTAAGTPARQLKGFNKTDVLTPGAKATVVFVLRPRDLSIWSVDKHDWEVQKGEGGFYCYSTVPLPC